MASAKKKGKKGDPISERARALTDQIASLEAQIKRLDTQLQQTPAPRLRSTAVPHGATVARAIDPPPAAAHEPVFEEVKPLRQVVETAAPDQFNEFGVRKYDLPGLFGRLRQHFRRPTTSNPRLVTYLAAGGVQGLRPLRYEKRVARNRFILLVVVLFLILLGVISLFVHNH
jgi:type II secretory pathway component PulM